MVGSVAALATHPYDEWPQDVQDAARGHAMATALAPDPFPFVPEVDYLNALAPTSGHERSPSPPTQTIDPNLPRPPSPPVPSKREARSIVSKYIASAGWISTDTEEPNLGNLGVPPCASLLAGDGSSIFRCLIDLPSTNALIASTPSIGFTAHWSINSLNAVINRSRAPKDGEAILPLSDLRTHSISDFKASQAKASSWEAITTHLNSSPHKGSFLLLSCAQIR